MPAGAGIKPDASVIDVWPTEPPILSEPPPYPLSGTGVRGRGEFPVGVPRRLTSWLLGLGGGTGGGGVGAVYILGFLSERELGEHKKKGNPEVRGESPVPPCSLNLMVE